MSGPLAGIRVFDLTHAGVGPWGAMLLAHMGADVIKVESPGPGDRIRLVPPEQKGMGVVYVDCNFNKRGIVIDLKKESNRQIALELIETCDVFLENMKPGTVDRLGLGYEAVSKVKPDIIYLVASAYGKNGPMGREGGSDQTVQPFGAWCGITGKAGGPPEVFRHFAHLDFTTSCYIVPAILQALIAREKTGKGQKAEIAMTAASMALQTSRLAEYLAGGKPGPMGSACQTTVPHEAFLCEDKKYIAVGVVKEEQWPRLCVALGLDELANDSRFDTNAKRVENREALIPRLAEVFVTKPVSWWVLRLTKQGVPNGRFLDFEALKYHPTVVENKYIELVDTEHWGPIYAGGLPWSFSKTPVELKRGPAPGEHTEEVVAELKQLKDKMAVQPV